ILTILVGGHPYALVTYRWVGGNEGNRESQRNYTFRTAGTQQVECNVELSVNESSLRAGDPLIQRIPRFTAVDVEIAGDMPAMKVEVHQIQIDMYFVPKAGTMVYETLERLTNRFDIPNFTDERTLPLAQDDSFSYAGRRDPYVAPRTFDFGPATWHIEYSGRVDLEKWMFTVSGKWTRDFRTFNGKKE